MLCISDEDGERGALGRRQQALEVTRSRKEYEWLDDLCGFIKEDDIKAYSVDGP